MHCCFSLLYWSGLSVLSVPCFPLNMCINFVCQPLGPSCGALLYWWPSYQANLQLFQLQVANVCQGGGCPCWAGCVGLQLIKSQLYVNITHFRRKQYLITPSPWQVHKASDIIYNEGLNMYNLYDNCPHTTAGNFSRHEADLSNIFRQHDFHSTLMLRAKSKWVVNSAAYIILLILFYFYLFLFFSSFALGPSYHENVVFIYIIVSFQTWSSQESSKCISFRKTVQLDPPCTNGTNLLTYLNNPEVRTALHIPLDVKKFELCK